MNTIKKRPVRRNGPNRNNANNQRSKPKSTIDISQIQNIAAKPSVEIVYNSKRSFAEMPLHQNLRNIIQKKGYDTPTEIQDKTFEHLLNKRDLLGIAKTGTGKTAAFLIPLINQLISNPNGFNVLVLAPTRELAVQIDEEFKSLTSGLKLYSQCFIGGTNINRDLQKLNRKSHFVIGTPGRLLDLYQRRALRFSDFGVLVLDEFDRMLDMGFSKDVHRIVDAMQNRKHTLLFSATLDNKQKGIIDNLLNNPVTVKVSSGSDAGDHIEQEIIKVESGEDKFDVLKNLVQNPEFAKVLVFAETKRWVTKVHKKLTQAGIHSDQIHGNKSQNYRQTALKKFSDGKIQVLVATDVAARGLDVSDVTHVINYQLPSTMDSYIHRIGRTGRAGKAGKAYTFIN